MKNKLFFILNLAAIFLVSIFQDLYITEDNILFKAFASLAFVLVGVINLVYAIKNKTIQRTFCIIMLIGLFFAMLGDILLEIQFMVGAGFFAIGHILFIVAYYFVERFHWLDLLIGGILALTSALIVTLVPIFDFVSLMLEILIVFYAIII